MWYRMPNFNLSKLGINQANIAKSVQYLWFSSDEFGQADIIKRDSVHWT